MVLTLDTSARVWYDLNMATNKIQKPGAEIMVRTRKGGRTMWQAAVVIEAPFITGRIKVRAVGYGGFVKHNTVLNVGPTDIRTRKEGE